MQKLFLNFFLYFWNEDKFLNIFKKKMTLIAHAFLKLRTPKTLVRYMSKKSLYWTIFQKQHGKRVQTLLKSEPQHL